MYIMLYMAFLNNGDANGYTIPQMCTYLWMQQAFLRLFNMWTSGLDEDIVKECQKGDTALELVRPVDLYFIWHAKTFAKRIAKVIFRAIPIFLICSLPILGQYKICGPANLQAFIFFIITLILSALIVMAYTMVEYAFIMKEMTTKGISIVFEILFEFCSGSMLPLVFMPNWLINVLKFTPFYYTQHTTYNIYNGYISDIKEILTIIIIQIIWLTIITLIGKYLIKKHLKKVVVQGG